MSDRRGCRIEHIEAGHIGCAASEKGDEPFIEKRSTARHGANEEGLAGLKIQKPCAFQGRRHQHAVRESPNHGRGAVRMTGHGGCQFIGADSPGFGGSGFQCVPFLIDGDAAARAGINRSGTGPIAKNQGDIMRSQSRLDPIGGRGGIDRQARVPGFPSAEHGHADPGGWRKKERRVPTTGKPRLGKVCGKFVGEGVQLRVGHFIITELDRNSLGTPLNDFPERLDDGGRLLMNLGAA